MKILEFIKNKVNSGELEIKEAEEIISFLENQFDSENCFFFRNLVQFRGVKPYNKNFGDDKICQCGHAYYRHFDTYDDMYPVGCKYCECFEFKE